MCWLRREPTCLRASPGHSVLPNRTESSVSRFFGSQESRYRSVLPKNRYRRSSSSVSSVRFWFRTELTDQLRLLKNQRLGRAHRTLGRDAVSWEVGRHRGRWDSGSPRGRSSVPWLVRLTEGRNRINRTNFGSSEMGTEQGTEISVLGKFGSVLGFFGSVLGSR